VLLLDLGGDQSIPVWQTVSAASRWVVPPLADLLHAATPFTSPATLWTHGVLLVQAGAWTAILVVATAWRHERADFGLRFD
jgi:hypothetical protein